MQVGATWITTRAGARYHGRDRGSSHRMRYHSVLSHCLYLALESKNRGLWYPALRAASIRRQAEYGTPVHSIQSIVSLLPASIPETCFMGERKCHDHLQYPLVTSPAHHPAPSLPQFSTSPGSYTACEAAVTHHTTRWSVIRRPTNARSDAHESWSRDTIFGRIKQLNSHSLARFCTAAQFRLGPGFLQMCGVQRVEAVLRGLC